VSRVVLFAVAFAFWLALVGPDLPAAVPVPWADIGFGALAALVVAVVMGEMMTGGYARLLDPVRYFWLLVYLGVLAWYVLRANLDVAYRVLHPALPIRPGIVALRTRLRSDSARVVLANSVTLTPGTLTVDMTADGVLYVHWINVSTVDGEEAARVLLGRFEWLIGRILE
jgi:multicomponent Na+:H+ antiporter subunit E